KGDTARRVVPIDLESLLERPQDRKDFQHPMLLEWVRQEYPRLVSAALTVLRAYFVAGCPKQNVTYGSFEAWSDLVCKFQSENVPEYKKKTGKNQGEKCTTAPSGLSASTLFLVISQSFADQLPQSSSLTRGELPGTRLLSNLV